ncbi:MAG: VCBS repeat-containing protein, partial [Thermoplasmata archaeon]|nr:VCBS repeat-containing protein [Thermoplasmata archaeon]
MYVSNVDSYQILRNLDGYGVVMMSETYPSYFGLSHPETRQALMDWVADGGSLFVIYPPNTGSMVDFLGVTFTLDAGNGLVVADPDHPIVNYPYTAVTQGWPQTYEARGYWTDFADDGYVPVLTHPDVPSGAVTMVKHHGKGVIVLDSSLASYTRYLDTGSWIIENTLSFIQRNRVKQLASSSTAPAVQSSDHAMDDYFDNIFTYRYPGATAISVHISEMDMEDGYDFIQVLDAKGRLQETFTGAATDLWTMVVPGDTIYLRVITDGSIKSWGFETDLLRHYGQWVAEIPAMDMTGKVTYYISTRDGAGNAATSPTYTMYLTEPPVVMNITTGPDHPSGSDAITVNAEVLDSIVRDDIPAEWDAGSVVDLSVDASLGVHLSETVDNSDRYFAGDDHGKIYMLKVGPDLMVTSSTQIATMSAKVRGLVCGDFDEDGDVDVVVMNMTDGYLYLIEQTSEWNFSSPVSTGTYTGVTNKDTYGFDVGDFNEDGHLDIVGGGNQRTIRLFAGQGNGTFNVSTVGTISADLRSIAVGDIDNDGHLDLLVAPLSGNLLSYLGHGNGTFTIRTTVFPYPGTSGASKSVDLADLDGDGNLDIIVNTRYLYIHMGHGDGVNFTYGGSIADVSSWGEMEILDMDDDGDLDLILVRYAQRDVRTYENTGLWRQVPMFNLVDTHAVSSSIYVFGLTRSQPTFKTSGSVTSPVHDMGSAVDWRYVQLDHISTKG